ncbi:MAG: hypothetical protein ABI395_01315 [Sphingobium sp.]
MENNRPALNITIGEEFKKQARRFKNASLFVKLVLVAGFSAIAGVAQFFQFPSSGPESSQVIGIIATIVVATGAIFIMITEQDATEQLALAQAAIEAAREAQSQFDILDQIADDTSRLIELFQALSVMRGAIERLTALNSPDEDEVADRLLKSAERSLAIAMAFDQADLWTIGVYRAVPCPDEQNRALLKCVAHKRAIVCEVSEARVWKEGTGIMGVSYANSDEIIVPDLQIEGMRAVFGTSANTQRDYDQERYRSMIAVPIKVHGMVKPWGVVTATSDRVSHFSYDGAPGVRTDEGARVLANMIALAIAVVRKS